MTALAVPESAVLASVIDLLLWQYKAVIIRVNSGATSPQNDEKGARFITFNYWQALGLDRQIKGVSDVLALLPPPPGAVVSYPDAVGKWPERVSLWGLPLYCEIKSPDRRRNGQPAKPSPDQARFLEAVAERGGLALVVDDVQQLEMALTERGY